MTYDEFTREDARLREILRDALERGDYFLEMDVTETIVSLRQRWYASDDDGDDRDIGISSTQD